ncbi:hypothetical protein Cflav_PD4007 [Pedosphaera parvula Ellin514]|uniref:HEAT domain containing protein n=2 Tax=Pedosphaera TaxID=1032526 RepID=B9XGR7_PEDPL|nr:hypothetical protein Cflav_PD4007 [Pedosphaera parvula Ellin514]
MASPFLLANPGGFGIVPLKTGMKSPRAITIAATLLFLGFFAFYITRPQEPSYKGRTMAQWLSAANRPGNAQSNEYRDSMVAIKAIGTNAIPTLLKYLEARDSTFTLRVNSFLPRTLRLHFNLATAHEKHEWAYLSFADLGKEGLPAVPALGELAKHPNSDTRAWTFSCLYNICPEKQTYQPILTQFLHDQDRILRLDAARTIRNLYPSEAEQLGAYKEFPELKTPPATNTLSASDSAGTK